MNDIVVQSRGVLSKHAKSFRWASWFLPVDRRDDAAVVYAFCRLVDDIVDLCEDGEVAGQELDQIERELQGEAARPLIAEFLKISKERNLDTIYAHELIEGVRSDLGSVRFSDQEELLRYCYRVAGTVGLMMCAVLGVDDPKAHAHAVDLGVAMQITNICRDVLEDAQIERVYLPADLLRAEGVSQQSIIDGDADVAALARVVTHLVQRAESYYQSADHGMKFIPRASRFAILIASRLYRGIGLKLVARHNGNPMLGRVYTTAPEKMRYIASAFVAFFSPKTMGRFAKECLHDASLHRALHGLPGTNKSMLLK